MSQTINLRGLRDQLCSSSPPELIDDSPPVLYKPEKDRKFVEPRLKFVPQGSIYESGSSKLSADWDTPVIIISAPGAVGKSALAKELSSTSSFPLWDLSRIKIADGTFPGTIVNSFGAESLSYIMEGLRQGKQGFILDAFDEAEMTSGSDQVNNFVSSIWKRVKNVRNPCIVLLARGETAEYLKLIIESESNRKKAYSVFEIDYFNYEKSKEFTKLYGSSKSEKVKDHEGPFEDSVDKIFESIYEAFGFPKDKAWNNSTFRSFLGYAPVLQAIATYLASFDNFLEAQQSVEDGFLESGDFNVASKIMNDLILREKNDKVLPPVRNRLKDRIDDWDGWNDLYSKKEQIIRLLALVEIGEDFGTSDEYSPEMPGWVEEEYREVLKTQLTQHPFLQKGEDFGGPAFKDFVYASVLRSNRVDLRGVASEAMVRPEYVPTPLLLRFYRAEESDVGSGGDGDVNVFDADHFGYMYESFASGASVDGPDNLVVVTPPSPSTNEKLHSVEFYPPSDEANESNGEDDEVFSLYANTEGENNDIRIPRRVEHASIYSDNKVVIGSDNNPFEISDTEIFCEKLEIRSQKIIVRAKSKSHSVVLRSRSKPDIPPNMEIKVRSDEKEEECLKVYWPGGKSYPWSKYYKNIFDKGDISIDDTFYALRRILMCFRRDRRDNLARHKDMIDQRVVGKSQTKIEAFRFLKEKGVIYEENYLYKVDINKARENDINWSLIHEDIDPSEEEADVKKNLRKYLSDG